MNDKAVAALQVALGGHSGVSSEQNAGKIQKKDSIVINKPHIIIFVAVLAFATLAPAQTYSNFYSFPGGSSGQYPVAGVIQDSLGNFYGITSNGGTSGYGVVFKVTSSGAETVLHSFSGGADGEYPYSPLLRDSQGNLYGTTNSGGN